MPGRAAIRIRAVAAMVDLRGRRVRTDGGQLGHPPPLRDAKPVTLLEGAHERLGERRSPDGHPLETREIVRAGVGVEEVQKPEPDRRHAGRHRHPLARDDVEHALRIEMPARQHLLGPRHRRAERNAPRVGMEHRHDLEHHVARADGEELGAVADQRVQHERAMRVQHALGATRGAGGVAETGRSVLVRGPRELVVARARKQLLVVHGA